MKLHVPYCSYHGAQEFTRALSVEGVTCAKMILDYFDFNPNDDMQELIGEGDRIGACDASPFVMIDSLVVLLRVHGINAVKEYFRTTSFDLMLSAYVQKMYDIEARENGIANLITSIAEGVPALALVRREEEYPIVLFGYESEQGRLTGFYYHDPKNERGEDAFMTIDDFRNSWTRTAVLIEK